MTAFLNTIAITEKSMDDAFEYGDYGISIVSIEYPKNMTKSIISTFIQFMDKNWGKYEFGEFRGVNIYHLGKVAPEHFMFTVNGRRYEVESNMEKPSETIYTKRYYEKNDVCTKIRWEREV